MSEIRAVIFDIGGVLVRTENGQPRETLGFQFGLDRKGIEGLVFGNPASALAEIGQADESAVWKTVQDKLGLSADQLSVFRDRFWEGDRLDMPLYEWLTMLHPRYKTALLTNSWLRDPLDLFIKRYHLPEQRVRGAFDAVISSAAVGFRKPDPHIYQAAIDALGVQASEAVFVDDFEQNVAAARDFGLHAVHFTGADQVVLELHSLLGV
ncbi:MAG TPA: HAD family phosphatase [Anaerolinea sp.]|nr:HAD family phosphatase [Anaerolinea sp.]